MHLTALLHLASIECSKACCTKSPWPREGSLAISRREHALNLDCSPEVR